MHSVRKKQLQTWQFTSAHKNLFKAATCFKNVMIVITQEKKKNLITRSALSICTGIHLSPKIADMPIQVLHSTNSTSAETNYVLFP